MNKLLESNKSPSSSSSTCSSRQMNDTFKVMAYQQLQNPEIDPNVEAIEINIQSICNQHLIQEDSDLEHVGKKITETFKRVSFLRIILLKPQSSFFTFFDLLFNCPSKLPLLSHLEIHSIDPTPIQNFLSVNPLSLKIDLVKIQMKAKIALKNQEDLLSQEVKEIMQNRFQCSICEHTSTLSNQILKECDKVKEWQCIALVCTRWYKKLKFKMLPTIQDIYFSRLKIINFGKRLVASIEPFSRLEVPLLEELWLGDNNITTVTCLRKSNWKNFKRLNIVNNQVQEAPNIFEVDWPTIGRIEWELSTNYYQCQSIGIWVKYRVREGKRCKIECFSEERITEKSKFRKIEHKFGKNY